MRIIYKYTINLALVLVMLSVETTIGQEASVCGTTNYDLSFVRRSVNYKIRESVDNTGNLYISYQSQLPSVLTFVNKDGTVTVCTSDDKNTYIYEYSTLLKETKTLSFKNLLGTLGAFTKDDEGNYYFFYAENTSSRSANNMAVIKYNNKGKKMKQYKLKSLAQNSFNGVKKPFRGGTCRLEISGSMLAVYFAREMFNGHQASYGFILHKDKFNRLDNGQVKNNKYIIDDVNVMPYVSHSFNQFILPINNGFIFVDHGDAHPRAFCFSRYVNGSRTKRQDAFTFPGATGENKTTAQMGGVAKTSTGYIFVGTYGMMNDINSRNLFVLTFQENVNPLYLTQYTTNDGHAGHPKIVATGANRFLVLWEKFSFSTQHANIIITTPTEYLSTHMLLINEKGEALSDIVELEGVRLNMNDVIRFNPQNGKVYWAINDGEKVIKIFALDVANMIQTGSK